MPDRSKVLEVLKAVEVEGRPKDLVAAGVVRDAAVDGSRVTVTLDLKAPQCPMQEKMKEGIRRTLLAMDGVKRVDLDARTSQDEPAGPSPQAAPQSPPGPQAAPQAPTNPIPDVDRILAVGAGKGGVGKSTVALLIALALRRRGRRVGLLDADVYGPSIPRMAGVREAKPGMVGDRIQPIDAQGLRLMSIGFLVDPEQAVAWRGPLVHKALSQLLTDVAWDELDDLVVDLPPGTGDVHLSLAQLVPVTGAVVVSTPQEVALQDAMKAADLYQKTGIEILGLVENMSNFRCPHCGKETAVFGRGTVERAAVRAGLPYLGDLPINLALRASGDEGNATEVLETDAAAAEAVGAVTRRLDEEIEKRLATKPAPQILGTRS